MRHRLSVLLLVIITLFSVFIPTAAQEPTEAPVYDPTCAVELMKAYMDGWEYDHRESGNLDVVQAAQVARSVYQAFDAAKIDCKDMIGGIKQSLLRSMHGDYSAEDLARVMAYVDEVVGAVDYNDCTYTMINQYVRQVDWGTMTAIEIGKTVGEIARTVREKLPGGECDGTFQIIQEIFSRIDDIPPDGTMIATLYKVVGDATEGHYISESSCDYTLAKTFFEKVEWDNLTSADIVRLVADTFKITYKIGGDSSCDYDPALAITAMLLEDTYRFKPDASVIQQAYDAATGTLVPTPEVTPPPIVN